VSANAAELIPKSVKNSFLSIVCTVVAPFYFFGICYTKYQAKQGTQNSRDKKNNRHRLRDLLRAVQTGRENGDYRLQKFYQCGMRVFLVMVFGSSTSIERVLRQHSYHNLKPNGFSIKNPIWR
jgi:hypothetical protein